MKELTIWQSIPYYDIIVFTCIAHSKIDCIKVEFMET